MAIALQGLYNQTHQFSAGIVNITAPFVGNVLAIEVTTKPEYLPNTQVVGYLYQYYQGASKGYALRSGKDIISLELPESDSLSFVPTPYLSDTYTLSIKYATIGAVIDGENTIGLPQQILDLPNNVQAIDLQLDLIEAQIQEIEQSNINWNTVSGKPESFPPSLHNHVKAEITDLSLDWEDIEGKPQSFPPSPHTHTADQITGLSVGGATVLLDQNTNLESNKSYLATVNNLVCQLPTNPAIGDFIELQNGNFSSFRINHGNTSQQILNSSNQTTTGINSGIILKPYSSCKLVFLGANLWLLGSKDRTINNWRNPSLIPDQKLTYTANLIGSTAQYGSTTTGLYDGVKTASGNLANGLITDISNPTTIRLALNFANPVALTSFKIWNGQGNPAGTARSPVNFKLLKADFSEIESFSCSGKLAEYTEFTYNITNPNSSETANQWVLEFFNNQSSLIAIMELEVYGFLVSGGEISVI